MALLSILPLLCRSFVRVMFGLGKLQKCVYAVSSNFCRSFLWGLCRDLFDRLLQDGNTILCK